MNAAVPLIFLAALSFGFGAFSIVAGGLRGQMGPDRAQIYAYVRGPKQTGCPGPSASTAPSSMRTSAESSRPRKRSAAVVSR